MEIELPDGTILDAPDDADVKAVVQGYMAKQKQPQKQQSFFDREFSPAALKRGAGLATRSLTEAVTSLPLLPLDIGYAVGNVLQGRDDELPGQRFRRELPLPQPQGLLEKGTDIIGQAVLGAKLPNPMAPKPQTKIPAPTTQQLEASVDKAYETARKAGVVITPQSFDNAANTIAKAAKDAGIDATLHPKASAALRRIQEAAGAQAPQTLEEVEILRRIAKDAASGNDASETRVAKIIINQLDDYLTKLEQKDVSAGDPKLATKALQQARELYTRLSKSETIERLIRRAGDRAGQFSGSGYENALRTEFRSLALDDKEMRFFTAAEQEAIRKVGKGGFTAANALRTLGKLAPTGIVSASLGGGAGYVAGGPVGAGAVMAAGGLGRLGATELTKRSANAAAELMRQGPSAMQPTPPPVDLLRSLGLAGIFGAKEKEFRDLFFD